MRTKLTEDDEYLELLLAMQDQFAGHFVAAMKEALRAYLGSAKEPTAPLLSLPSPSPFRRHTKFFSPEARARIAAAQRARWAKLKASGAPLASDETKAKMRLAWERRRAAARSKAGAA